MIQPINRHHLAEVAPETLAYIEHLERGDQEHLAEVGRMREENVRVWEYLRRKCRHCAGTAEILGD